MVPPRSPVDLFHVSMGTRERKAVDTVLRSGWLSQGERVQRFETAFARYVGVPYAVAVNSCTSALYLSLKASGVGPGDEVITTPLTFIATINAVLHAGARPVFADIDPETWNLDPASLAEKITRRSRAVIPVHYAGNPAPMEEIRPIAADHRLRVIEDAAHALGAGIGEKKCGNLAPLGCFSFYPSKNITTGEGGMITCRTAREDRMLRLLRNHGMSRSAYQRHGGYTWDYRVELLGYNCRMSEMEAALGLTQLNRLESILRVRRRHAAFLRRHLGGLPGLRVQRVLPGALHGYHFFPIAVERGRERLLEFLHHQGILASMHYRLVYRHHYFRSLFGGGRVRCSAAEALERQLVSLPCHQGLRSGERERIVGAVTQGLRRIAGHFPG